MLSNEAAYHIEQARIRGGIPQTDSRFTTARMLSLLTAEMQGALAPMVHAAKSDHGVVPYSVTAPPGTARYSLPASAFANTLRDVFWIDANQQASPLTQISASNPMVYTLRGQPGSKPLFYTLQGSSVVLYPTPSVAGTLAMPYYARPANLVLVDEAPATEGAVQVAAVGYNATTHTLVVGTVVAPPTPLQPASTAVALDIVRHTPGFETIVRATEADVFAEELTPTSWQYTIVNVLENPGVAPGDYICLAGESPVPQIPVELCPLLHARVAYVAVPSTGDSSQAASALASQVAELTQRATDFLRPRVESASPEVGRGMANNPMIRGIG